MQNYKIKYDNMKTYNLQWLYTHILKKIIFNKTPSQFHFLILNFTYVHAFSLNLIGWEFTFILSWHKTWLRYFFCRKCFLAWETLFSRFQPFFSSLQAEIWVTKTCVNAYWFTTLVRLLTTATVIFWTVLNSGTQEQNSSAKLETPRWSIYGKTSDKT